jgi:hypothetical protein
MEKFIPYRFCKKCGRKIGIGNRDLCFDCNGIEIKDSNVIVKEIIAKAPPRKDLVSDEVIAKRKAGFYDNKIEDDYEFSLKQTTKPEPMAVIESPKLINGVDSLTHTMNVNNKNHGKSLKKVPIDWHPELLPYSQTVAALKDMNDEEKEIWKNALKEFAINQTKEIFDGKFNLSKDDVSDEERAREFSDLTFADGHESQFIEGSIMRGKPSIQEYLAARNEAEEFGTPKPARDIAYEYAVKIALKAGKVQDPEAMAKRMPKTSRSKSGKGTPETKPVNPKCPNCRVSVTDYGKCPVCQRTVTRRFNSNGNIVTLFNDYHEVRDRYEAPEELEIYVLNDGLKEVVGIGKREENWLKDEEIHKFNFVGTVNKKSDGRCNRTGEIPNPKDPERMSKFRHTPGFKLDFNVVTIRPKEGEKTRYINGLPIVKVKKDLQECQECGCKVTLKELRRNDKLCPKCGLRIGSNIVHLDIEAGDLDGD